MNIQTKLNLHIENEGLHQEKLTLFGKKLFPIPMFMQKLFFKHDIHHMVTGYGTDLSGEAKLLCWEVGAGAPWWYAELYFKFPFVCLFSPSLAMDAFKLGRTQHCLYEVEYELLRTKTVDEVEHFVNHGTFPED